MARLQRKFDGTLHKVNPGDAVASPDSPMVFAVVTDGILERCRFAALLHSPFVRHRLR